MKLLSIFSFVYGSVYHIGINSDLRAIGSFNETLNAFLALIANLTKGYTLTDPTRFQY